MRAGDRPCHRRQALVGLAVECVAPVDRHGHAVLAGTGADKYGLDQGDFYQLQAYGQSYLDGQGDVVLIYPRTDAFDQALPVFDFPKSKGLRLWVLPFCLRERVLVLPTCGSLDAWFSAEHRVLTIARPNGWSDAQLQLA